MILILTRQLEASVQVSNFIQEKVGWKALACAPKPTMDLQPWEYHASVARSGTDTIIYGWTLLNVLAEESPKMPPGYTRWWCREFMVRGGMVLYVEPHLDEGIDGVPQEAVQAEIEARQKYQRFLNEGIYGVPAVASLSMERAELEEKVVQADSFARFARRYESLGLRRFGYGSLAPQIVFLVPSPTDEAPGEPPFSNWRDDGPAASFAKVLDQAGLPEGELHFLFVTNTAAKNLDTRALELLCPGVVVLLGDVSREWYSSSCVRDTPVVVFCAPAEIDDLVKKDPEASGRLAHLLQKGIKMASESGTWVDARWTQEEDHGESEGSGDSHDG